MVGRRRKLRCGSCRFVSPTPLVTYASKSCTDTYFIPKYSLRRELALKEHVLHPLPQEAPPPLEEEPAPLPSAPTFLDSPAQAPTSSSPTAPSPLAKDSTTEESKEALPPAIPPFPPSGACVPVGPPEKVCSTVLPRLSCPMVSFLFHRHLIFLSWSHSFLPPAVFPQTSPALGPNLSSPL
jgi:hypothetical protein